MCFHIPISTMLNPKFLSAYCTECSVLVTYLSNPVVCVLLSLSKVLQLLDYANTGIIIILVLLSGLLENVVTVFKC